MIVPSVKAIFYITSSKNEFDLGEVSRRLGVTPTRTRRKADFPPQTPAQTSWSLEVKEENAFSVGTVLDKLIRRLAGENAFENVEKLCTLCSDLAASPRFEIVIHMQSGDGPEVVLSPKQVLFAAAIGAEIDLDLHCDP